MATTFLHQTHQQSFFVNLLLRIVSGFCQITMVEHEEQVIFYILLTLVWLVAILSFSMIWIYISNKALGMQTLYGFMIKDLLLVSTVTFAGASATNMAFGKAPPWLATSLVCFRFWGSILMLVQLLLVICVRYFSIFHSHVIMELNDSEFIRKTRVFNCLFSSACMIFEITRSNLAFGSTYKVLVSGEVNQEEQPVRYYTILTLGFLDILLMVILQVRVELLNHQMAKKEQQMDNESYDLGTIRVVIICGILIIFAVLLRFFKSRVRLIIMSSIAFNIIPCIFIFRNANMTRYFASRFAVWIVTVLAPNALDNV